MNGVYINIYYDSTDELGNAYIRVYRTTGTDEVFCQPMSNPHAIARVRRSRRWRNGL